MGDPKGFLKVKRQAAQYRPVCERIKDYREIAIPRSEQESCEQASRCMDCGTPFCHWGCPLANYIPEWNDLLFYGHKKQAWELLSATNPMPEITGRLCPALCEYACVLGIDDEPVTIRENELAIAEYAFKKGWVRPQPPAGRTGKRIAVVGSGPAGLTCADRLNRIGHKVIVFERDDKPGGILRYGIPDFKLEKWIIDRRIDLWKKEGIEFRCGVDAGRDYPADRLLADFDNVYLTTGARVPRDLNIPGRKLEGIYFAMDYLTQANRRAAGEIIQADKLIDAKGKKVVIIGGGDTGADCVGVAHRQGAGCVVQIELLPRPPECRTEDFPWPHYPLLLKTSTSHQEGGERIWCVLTKRFIGENGRVKRLSCVKVEFIKKGQKDKTCPEMKEIPGSEFEIEADLVILAMGFIHPEKEGLLDKLGVKLTEKGTVWTDEKYATSLKGVFAAGDVHHGASLIVWAIQEAIETVSQSNRRSVPPC